MIRSPIFTGCAAALVTPFSQDGTLDKSALVTLLHMQIDAQMDAVVLLGTTGEASTISMDEREQIIGIGVDTIRGRMPVIVGTGTNDTKKSAEYARQAYALGASAQLTVTPYYNKATQAGLIRHFSAIADSCDLPMILYNVPSRTGVSLALKTTEALAGHPNICGIKEASGDLSTASDLLYALGDSLPLYSGNDDLILPLMSIGAIGSISVAANIAPKQTKAITDYALQGKMPEARSAQESLLPLIRLLFTQVNPIPVKAALSMMGLIHDSLRLPLTPMEEPGRTLLREELKRLALI